ncbi:Fibroblast growth factor receptor [Hypsibius exemplaris]|uniref:Fibroblast growth factor receptor n=1 Tax=Hypsibius exemplaris TaxID=2072580 RepID=A0A1W0X5L8_HYPEX|nr:Fibroblast growth factor receptor [Hypsibius exemplaris]
MATDEMAPDYSVILIIVIPIVVIMPLCSIFLFLYYRGRLIREIKGKTKETPCLDKLGVAPVTSQRKESVDAPRRPSKFQETLKLRYVQSPTSAVDRWEIARTRITLEEVIGKGAFGQICLGKVDGTILAKDSLSDTIIQFRNRNVAVKMLSANASDKEQEAFLKEIKVMKDIGYHKQIISLIGCCTTSKPTWLIEEYCPLGDLKRYLMNLRELATENMPEPNTTNTDVNDASQWTSSVAVTLSTLLSYARQIAIGMEFLHEKGYVHRDLAARNVLLADRSLVKICDFGLTRFLEEDQLYAMHSSGKLPYKWMAIEAINDQKFTCATDVWSFGIVLFEIITLGGVPYPVIENKELLRYLRRGNRMECPDNCPPDLYSLMMECWKHSAQERPSFPHLRKKLEILLEDATGQDNYLQLNTSRDYYVQSETVVTATDLEEPAVEKQVEEGEAPSAHCLQFIVNEREF